MIRLGDTYLGFFYLKDENTLAEIDGLETVSLPSKYANTASCRVMVLLSKDGEVLDVDDIPSESLFDTCHKNFLSFVRSGEISAFLVFPERIGYADIVAGSDGELLSMEIENDDFTLRVLSVTNRVEVSEMEKEEKYLLIVSKDVESDESTRVVTAKSAAVALFSISS